MSIFFFGQTTELVTNSLFAFAKKEKAERITGKRNGKTTIALHQQST